MNSLVLMGIASLVFILGYRFYSRFLAREVFQLDDSRPTPAHVKQDGVDYVPTHPAILFGHHFTTIAGVSPIVGPAIAVYWGWLPAFLWVVLGGVFLGAVHDFGSMYLSLRHQGRSIGDLTREVVGARSRLLFLWIIFFLLLIVLAVFALVVSGLLIGYPQTFVPVVGITLVAVFIGTAYRRFGMSLIMMTVISVVIMYGLIMLGVKFPFSLPAAWAGSHMQIWLVLILIYAYVAAVLPVWLLLQPRDHINAWSLFGGMALILTGLIIVHPNIVAPAINHAAISDPTAPPLLPILFITIACGAISGFHSLVNSGTTVRQLNKESDARSISYGSMIMESMLSVLTIVICCSAVSKTEWLTHYATWGGDNKLTVKLIPFIEGSASMIASLGIDHDLGRTIIGVVIISFALTTLDSCMRLQRFIVSELFGGLPVVGGALKNRFASGGFALVSALLLCFVYGKGSGGMQLWPLFGVLNQLLAALALLVLSTYLIRKGCPVWVVLPGMLFILLITESALLIKLHDFWLKGEPRILLGTIGLILLVFSIWIIVEASRVMLVEKGSPFSTTDSGTSNAD
jgi:carbon starvation protein